MRLAAAIVGGVGGVIGLLLSLRTAAFGAPGLVIGNGPSGTTSALGTAISLLYALAVVVTVSVAYRRSLDLRLAAILFLTAAIGAVAFGLTLIPPLPMVEDIGVVSLFTLPLEGVPLVLGGALLAFLASWTPS